VDAERQRQTSFRDTLPPADQHLYDVVRAQLNLQLRREGDASAVIHCPVGERILQSECNNDSMRSWFFVQDECSGYRWCIHVLPLAEYKEWNSRGDRTNLRAHPTIICSHNNPTDIRVDARVLQHLRNRLPVKVYGRCSHNELQAIGYATPENTGDEFIRTHKHESIESVQQAYPVLRGTSKRKRAADALAYVQTHYALRLRETPWPAGASTLPGVDRTPSAISTVSPANEPRPAAQTTREAEQWSAFIESVCSAK
jgi:hypothetical protein